MSQELPELLVPDALAWRLWLGEHHHLELGVWLVLAKKGVSEPASLTYLEALDEALCHGWIDGQIRGAPVDLGVKISSWQVDCDAPAAEVDECDEGCGGVESEAAVADEADAAVQALQAPVGQPEADRGVGVQGV